MGSVLSRFESLIKPDNAGISEPGYEDSGIETSATPIDLVTDGAIRDGSCNVTEALKSPSSVHELQRTPLPVSRHDMREQHLLVDPRSPTLGIERTPICSIQKEDSASEPVSSTTTFTTTVSTRPLLDPRSPSCDIERSAIIAECEVHANQVTDSMYVNTPVSLVVGDLDLSSDPSESDDVYRGSMENLLNDSAELVPSEETGPNVNCEEEEDENEMNMSPIGSPVRALSVAQDNLVASSVKCSTPKVKAAARRTNRVLAQRDTNSPLNIVQRKQISKIHEHISTTTTTAASISNSTCGSNSRADGSPVVITELDKENAVTTAHY